MNVSTTHLVLIPSYNTGATVYETVRAARAQWQPVWVVVDGSDDGTAVGLTAMMQSDPGLKVIVLPENRGKGAAVLHGLQAAVQAGFTHALTMDSDGQHPAESIVNACVNPACAAACRPCSTAAPLPRFSGSTITLSPGSDAASAVSPAAVPSSLPSTTTQTGCHCARAARTVS